MLMRGSILDWFKVQPKPVYTITPQPPIPVQLEGMIGLRTGVTLPLEQEIGLQPQPIQLMEEVAWLREPWATPYMAAVAATTFGPTAKFRGGVLGKMWTPDIPGLALPKPPEPKEALPELGAEPGAGEWFK